MAVIALDGRKYFDFGIGTYIRQLVNSLSLLRSPHTFILYVSPSDKSSVVLPAGWTSAEAAYPKYSISEIAGFGYRARRDNVDVFHEPHYTLPAGVGNISIATIHDVIHLRFPELFSPLQRAYSRAMIWHALRHSHAVIVDSEFTKRDILGTFHVNPDKIRVIPLGVGRQYRPLKKNGVVSRFRDRFGLDRRYILYVGNVKPHKGIDTLLEAFRKIQNRTDADVVTVGGFMRDERRLDGIVSEFGLDGRVRELGRLPDEDLVAAYNGAEMLVVPSRYEGFGLPALEAMSCGVPVVASDAGSLPEVVGDAALVFKAGDAKELADRLLNVFRGTSVKRELVRKGKERAMGFTWRRTAEMTLEVYEQIIAR